MSSYVNSVPGGGDEHASPNARELTPFTKLPIEESHRARILGVKVAKALGSVAWVPPTARLKGDSLPEFKFPLTLLFCILTAVLNANLFWGAPVIEQLRASPSTRIVGDMPSLSLAGYALALILFCPLADEYRSRPILLLLCLTGATFTLCLAESTNSQIFKFFEVLACISVAGCQILMAIIGEVVPPRRRAARIAMLISATQIGAICTQPIVLALVRYSSWRALYWFVAGIQYVSLILVWLFFPDFPTNCEEMSYPNLMRAIWHMQLKKPVVFQAGVLAFSVGAVFPSQWSLLRSVIFSGTSSDKASSFFLPVAIGCLPMLISPAYAAFFGRKVTSMVTVCLGIFLCLTGIILGNASFLPDLLEYLLQIFLAEFGRELLQVGVRLSMFSGVSQLQNSMEALFVFWSVIGSLTATYLNIPSVANWQDSTPKDLKRAIPSLLFLLSCLVIALARGPREKRWVGWHGGMQWMSNTED